MGIGSILSFLKEIFFTKDALDGYVRRNRFSVLLFIAVLFLFFITLFITEQAVNRQAALEKCKVTLTELDRAVIDFRDLTKNLKSMELCQGKLEVCEAEVNGFARQITQPPKPVVKPKPTPVKKKPYSEFYEEQRKHIK